MKKKKVKFWITIPVLESSPLSMPVKEGGRFRVWVLQGVSKNSKIMTLHDAKKICKFHFRKNNGLQ